MANLPAHTTNDPKPWDKLPEETALWYDRFLTFISLGPARSIEKLYRARSEGQETSLRGKRSSSGWHTKAQEYNWKARAEAHDKANSHELLAAEEKRRIEARERRRTIIDALIDKVNTAIDLADLEHMDTATARLHLQTLSTALLNLIKAHRLEMGEPTEIQDSNINAAATIQFTADDLAAAQRQLAEYNRSQEEAHAPA